MRTTTLLAFVIPVGLFLVAGIALHNKPVRELSVSVQTEQGVFEGRARQVGPVEATLTFGGTIRHFHIKEDEETRTVYLLSSTGESSCFEGVWNTGTFVQVSADTPQCKRNK